MAEQKVIHGDALEVLKTFEDGSFDLVLTDPPYGDGIGYGRNGKEIANNEDESINYRVLPELYRVLADGGICYLFTNWKFSGKILHFIETETKFYPRMQLVVVKNNFGMGYGFRNQYELVWVLEKGEHKYLDAGFSNVQKMEHIEHDQTSHPHEKGTELLQRMIQHAMPCQRILDPFAGSGSTLAAARFMGLDATGIELDEGYFKYATDRLLSIPDSLF
jgi:DNA modification methylase